MSSSSQSAKTSPTHGGSSSSSSTNSSALAVFNGRRRRSVTDVADAHTDKNDLQLSELLAELTLDMCRKVRSEGRFFASFFRFLGLEC